MEKRQEKMELEKVIQFKLEEGKITEEEAIKLQENYELRVLVDFMVKDVLYEEKSITKAEKLLKEQLIQVGQDDKQIEYALAEFHNCLEEKEFWPPKRNIVRMPMPLQDYSISLFEGYLSEGMTEEAHNVKNNIKKRLDKFFDKEEKNAFEEYVKFIIGEESELRFLQELTCSLGEKNSPDIRKERVSKLYIIIQNVLDSCEYKGIIDSLILVFRIPDNYLTDEEMRLLCFTVFSAEEQKTSSYIRVNYYKVPQTDGNQCQILIIGTREYVNKSNEGKDTDTHAYLVESGILDIVDIIHLYLQELISLGEIKIEEADEIQIELLIEKIAANLADMQREGMVTEEGVKNGVEVLSAIEWETELREYEFIEIHVDSKEFKKNLGEKIVALNKDKR